MSDTTIIDHDENETPRTTAEQAGVKDERPTATTERVGEPMPERGRLGDLVPVGPRGVSANTLGQQIDYAEAMSKGKEAIPPHLRGNVGACLAVVDIATRADLSPYMVANQTYVQNGRVAFQSQLVHALITASGVLQGNLRLTYEGEIPEGYPEGDTYKTATRRCVVSGLLKGERVPHVHRGGTIAELHPGHSTKDGKRFVKGSPLWDRKPDIQLAYDAVRDWGRLFTPGALMGVMDQHEVEEYAEAIDAARQPGPTVLTRLASNKAKPVEGFNHDTVHGELTQVVGNGGTVKKPEPKAAAKPAAKPAKTVEKAAAKPVAKAAAKPENKIPPKVQQPTTAREYQDFALKWIGKMTDKDDALGRWDGERDIRDELKVPVATRKALERAINDKFSR